MSTAGLVLVGLTIVVGLTGIVVPVLPGSLLVLAAIAVWAVQVSTTTGWIVLASSAVVILGAAIVKYVVPGRRLQDAGVPGRAMVAGAVVGIIGFFVIPFVGLVIGFVLGVYAYELHRSHTQAQAWASTKHAMQATGVSILIELTGALAAVGFWLAGLVLT